MQHKITSIYPQELIEIINQLICCDKSFQYDARQDAIFADLDDISVSKYKDVFQASFERTEPTQTEVDALYEELTELLEQTDEGYVELSENVYARAEQGTEYLHTLNTITEVDVSEVQLDTFDIVFCFGQDYISAHYFTKQDQVKVYKQAIKDLTNGR